MKVKESTVRQIEITEVPGLDPIRVVLNDIGPRQGRINIECWGKSWASYWGGMGDCTIAQFFCQCGNDYLTGNLAPNLSESVFCPNHLEDHLKLEIIKERRKGFLTHEEARERFSEINETIFPETVDGLWSISEKMARLMGDGWWYRLPEAPNPDYEYLCRIIDAVKAALKQTETKGGEK